MNNPALDPQLQDAFARNQTDLTLDDIRVQWCGAQVRLYLGEKTLTLFGADNALVKTLRWCVKNHYRCSQVRALRSGQLGIWL